MLSQVSSCFSMVLNMIGLYVYVVMCIPHQASMQRHQAVHACSPLSIQSSSVCAQHKPDRIYTSCNGMLDRTAVLYFCRSYTLVRSVMARTGLSPQKPPLACPAQPQPTNLSLHWPSQILMSPLVQLQIPHLAGAVQKVGGGPKQKLAGRKFEQP